jgi:steroid 5-alpha reductase family enzyme
MSDGRAVAWLAERGYEAVVLAINLQGSIRLARSAMAVMRPAAGSGDASRRLLVLALTAVWGLRLGTHIYSRNAGQGEDKR